MRGRFRVSAPPGRSRSRRNLVQEHASLSQRTAQQKRSHILRSFRPVRLDARAPLQKAALEQKRDCNQRPHRVMPPTSEGEPGRQVCRLESIAAMLRSGQRPAEAGMRGKGQQECAHKLPVSEPYGVPEIAPLEREHIDKHGLRAREKNIQRRGILEDVPAVQ